MNFRQVFFAAAIGAGIGAVIGLGTVQIAAPPYQSDAYKALVTRYPLFGAIGGLIGGSVIEAVRQLKVESDRRES